MQNEGSTNLRLHPQTSSDQPEGHAEQPPPTAFKDLEAHDEVSSKLSGDSVCETLGQEGSGRDCPSDANCTSAGIALPCVGSSGLERSSSNAVASALPSVLNAGGKVATPLFEFRS